jgi:hypothetical protein
LTAFSLPFSEKLLATLHNFSATNGEWTRTSGEIAQFLQADVNEVNWILDRHVSGGYVVGFTNYEGNKKYHLTSTGIITVSAQFSGRAGSVFCA